MWPTSEASVEMASHRARSRSHGRARGLRTLGLLSWLALAPLLAACESTQEKSAKIERYDKAHAVAASKQSLSIAQPSRDVKVLSTTLLANSEAAAVTVTMRNLSSHALSDVPIEITVRGPNHQVLYSNNAPGITGALIEVPLLLPGQEFTWVNDQVQLSGGTGTRGATVQALVGEVPPVAKPAASLPRLTISGVHTIEEAALGEGTAGTVANPSNVTQSALVVFGVARRSGRIVAAGRALLPQLPAGRSLSFQIFLIGEPKGASVEVNAPPSTLE
jgi:hypothetical protein